MMIGELVQLVYDATYVLYDGREGQRLYGGRILP